MYIKYRIYFKKCRISLKCAIECEGSSRWRASGGAARTLILDYIISYTTYLLLPPAALSAPSTLDTTFLPRLWSTAAERTLIRHHRPPPPPQPAPCVHVMLRGLRAPWCASQVPPPPTAASPDPSPSALLVFNSVGFLRLSVVKVAGS